MGGLFSVAKLFSGVVISKFLFLDVLFYFFYINIYLF